MSPEIARKGQYKLSIWSQEEDRMHVHVRHRDGRTAKVWIEPEIEIEKEGDFKNHELNVILKLCREYENDIKAVWRETKED